MEAAADFPQINEGFGACCRTVAQEEVLLQVNLSLARVLKKNKIKRHT